MSKLGDRLRRWARDLKRDIAALWLAARDPRVPLPAKLMAAAVVAYALSPIDLIPDFVPLLGYLDDLLLLPAGIWLALRLVPPPLLAELRQKAADQPRRPASTAAAVVIALIWLAGAGLLGWWLLEWSGAW